MADDYFTKGFYDLLGVSKDAGNARIKKAYLQKCKTEHPDRGGDPDRFKHLKYAYEVLTDSDKRAIYDKYGLEGLKKREEGPGGFGGGGQGDLGDFLARAFGFDDGTGGGGRQQEATGEDMQFRLGVTLPDLYNGKKVPLKFKRRECCKKCQGSGSTKKGATSTCEACHGHGVKTVMRSLGRGMMQQYRTTCPDCRGEGISIDRKHICKECDGQRLVIKSVEIDAEIPPGTVDGERITLRGEAHQIPDGRPGNVVLHIKQMESRQDPCPFERKGNDLVFNKTINLAQALCGYKFTIEHMDGRTLLVHPEPNAIVHPGGMHIIHDEGMPRRENKHLRGNLYIKFKVTFPPASQISKELKDEIRKLLPPEALDDSVVANSSKTEEVEALPWNPRNDPEPGATERSTNALYSSGDDEGHDGGPQCVHQ